MKHILIYSLLFFYFTGTAALTYASTHHPDYILQQEQKHWYRLANPHTEKTLKKLLDNYQNEETSSKEQDSIDNPCITAKKITLSGYSVFSNQRLQRLISPFLGQCLTNQTLETMLRHIDHLYADHGYILSRAFIHQTPAMYEGEFHIFIQEGHVDRIDFGENTPAEKRQIRMAFPNVKEKIFNLRQMEQGRDQMNRLYSNHITMKISPAEKIGFSDIKLENNPREKNHLALQFDNAGHSSTGEYRATLKMERDNLFSLNDHLLFSATRSLNKDRNTRYSDNALGLLSVPYGKWTFQGQLSYANYRQTLTSFGLPLVTKGRSKQGKLRLSRLISRQKRFKFSGYGALTLKDNDRYLDDIKSNTSSHNLTIATLGAEGNYIFAGGVINGDIAYHRGTPYLWASTDQNNHAPNTPHAEFSRWNADIQFYKPLQLGTFTPRYLATLSAQHSPHTLYGSERISIGDQYTIRGFQEENIQGDSGAFLRQELRYTIPKWTDENALKKALGDLTLYGFFDAGKVQSRGGKQSNFGEGAGSLSGWGMGIRNQGKYVHFDLAYAKPLHAPEFIEKRDREIYGSIGVSLRW